MRAFVCGGGDGCKVRDGEMGWQEKERERSWEEEAEATDAWRNGRARGSDWQAETQTDGGEIERQGPNLLRLQIKGEWVQRLGPSAVWSADKARRFWKRDGPRWSQISPPQWPTPHKRTAGPGWFMSRLASKPHSNPENTPNNMDGSDWVHLYQTWHVILYLRTWDSSKIWSKTVK